MKKYTLIGLNAYMKPLEDDAEGGWIKYSDHKAEIAKLKAQPAQGLVEECPNDCWWRNHSYPLMEACDICSRRCRADKYQPALSGKGEGK